MNEDKIIITCPQCGKSARVPKGNPNKTIRCSNPECGFIGSMMLYTQKKIKAQMTTGRTTSTSSETVLMTAPQTPATAGTGWLKVVSTGNRFPLKTGSNIVGREHPTGHADIAIPCNDNYMSRHHIKIEGVITSKGTEYRLSDNNSTNKVKLNGSTLPPGDIVILKSGDRIIIGHTQIEFILQSQSADAGQTLLF